jgi:hypothetical protein
VWTGQLLVIWGGQSESGQALRDGAVYDPRSEAWELLPDAPVSGHQAAWDGTGLLVWGVTPAMEVAASHLSIADRRWDLSIAPLALGHALEGAWINGSLVLVSYQVGAVADVAVLGPERGRWDELDWVPVSGSASPPVVGSLEALFLVGAPSESGEAANFALNPRTHTWRELQDAPFAGFRPDRPLWTGRLAVFLGMSLVAYDPAQDSWLRLVDDLGLDREGYASAWVGDRIVVWGGSPLADGAPPLANGLEIATQRLAGNE